MSADEETLAVYSGAVARYAEMVADAGDDPLLAAFIGALPAGGQVLDLGCGPGIQAAAMARAGLRVTATDAVPEMVALAAAQPGVKAQVARFDDIAGRDIYDGIWANFSLLHAPRADLPRHLAALRGTLRPGGLFHIGMKTGTGERRDSLGRLYTYVSADALDRLLRQAGLTPFASTAGRGAGLSGQVDDWIAVSARG